MSFSRVKFSKKGATKYANESAKKRLNFRENSKGLNKTLAKRRLIKQKSLENGLTEAYNWLQEIDIIAVLPTNFNQQQRKNFLDGIQSNYVLDGTELLNVLMIFEGKPTNSVFPSNTLGQMLLKKKLLKICPH